MSNPASMTASHRLRRMAVFRVVDKWSMGGNSCEVTGRKAAVSSLESSISLLKSRRQESQRSKRFDSTA
jgi:hypothetical protein